MTRTPLLQPAKHTQTALKFGILGFPGSGKTYTAFLLAIGLAKLTNKPLAFFDTEAGSDYLLKIAELEDVPVLQFKGDAFKDLVAVAKEAEAMGAPLIVDSITQVWRELMRAYEKRFNVTKLKFQHWGPIKETWWQWTEQYLRSPIHIIVCGRAGYEYDFEPDEDGTGKELVKVGTKMKVETEFGYEPSFLVEMIRLPKSAEAGAGWVHQAVVLKDRTNTMNGAVLTFEGAVYKQGDWYRVYQVFEPLLKELGHEHVALEARNSQEVFPADGHSEWAKRKQLAEVATEEIKGIFEATYAGMDAQSKKIRQALLKTTFGTYSWTQICASKLEILQNGVILLKKFEQAIRDTGEFPETPDAAVALLITVRDAPTVPRPIALAEEPQRENDPPMPTEEVEAEVEA